MNADNLILEQLPNKTWVWYHHTTGAALYRSPTVYKTRVAARKAGEAWLHRRAQPRLRGR